MGQNRVFRKKKEALPSVFIVIVAALGFYFSLSGRSTGLMLAAFLFLFVSLLALRLTSATYTFTSCGMLVIRRGLLLGTRKVRLECVTTVRRYRAFFGMVRCLLLQYDAHQFIAVQPDDEEAFLAELGKVCPKMILITNDEE